ncbi:MAG: hypothetical protein LAP38_00085 [Acidobacteriia bacterium]|nr:hypothetical protein [Terriglobia bacterium]
MLRIALLFLTLSLCVPAQQVITTYAGTDWLFAGDGQPGTQSAIGPPVAVATDQKGNLYVVVTAMNTLLKVVPSGTVSIVAGNGLRISAGDGGPARAALLDHPGGVAADSAGNLYILDSFASRLREIGLDGTIRTIVGTGANGFSGDNGPATKATLTNPTSVAVDQAGNIFILDSNNLRLRKIANGIITTIAGNGQSGFSPDGAPALNSMISGGGGVAVDGAGNLYIADLGNCRVRTIDSGGVLRTVAGSTCGFSGDGGPATKAALSQTAAVAFDSHNNMYIADRGNQRIRRVDANGIITTFAGNGSNDFAGDGSAPLAAAFSNPSGVAVDGDDNVYVADRDNQRVRKIAAGGGAVSTILGIGSILGDGGPASAGFFNNPLDVAVDSNGVVYLADADSQRIRMVTPGGVVSTAVGTGRQGFSPDGTLAAAALVSNPSSLTIDPQGNLVFGDAGNGRIRRVGSDGKLVTISGGGQCCTLANGVPAAGAYLSQPGFLRYDSTGNLYFSNGFNVVQKITPTGLIVTLAGSGDTQFSGDGGPATKAGIGRIVALAVDNSRNLYLADYLHSRIRKVDQNGVITTIAGNGTIAFSEDGKPALQTTLALNAAADGVAIDKAGTVFFSDTNRIRRIAADGTISTYAGSGNFGFSGDGGLASAASLETPCGLVFDSQGNLLITDQSNRRIREVLSGQVPIITLSQKGLTFNAISGVSPASQALTIVNGALGVLNFGITVSTASGGNWLSTSISGGSVAAGKPGVSVDVRIDTKRLATGDYYGQVVITGPGVPNSPQSVTVVLHVIDAASVTGGVSLLPGGLVFIATQGAAAPAPQSLTLSTLSVQALSYGATATFGDGRAWFTLANTSGNIFNGKPAVFAIQPNVSGFSPGIYSANLTIAAGQEPIQQPQLLLIVTAPSGTSSNARAAAPACTASKLAPVITSLASGFTVFAAWPIPIEANIFDDCGHPLLSGSVTATFSTGDAPLSLRSLQDGRWAATWQTQKVSAQAQINVQAASSSGALTGTAQVVGGLQVNPDPPPQIASGGVLNGASYQLSSPLAPGSLIAVFGTHLSTSNASANSLPLPSVLNDTQVLVAGRSLPLVFVSDTQVNAEIPFDLAINATQQVIVTRGTTVSLPEPVSIVSDRSGVFTLSGDGLGSGFIVAVYSDGRQALVGNDNPVKPGDAIVIYATGLGDVDPRVIAGTAAPITPLSSTVNPVTVTVGGLPAQVFFSGLTPGFAGLYQVNAFVPAGVPAGNNVQVVLTQNGISSAPVSIAVQGQ